MPIQAPDQEKSVEEQVDQTLAQKVEALQERVRKMGVISDIIDDKAFMDEGGGEDSGTVIPSD